MKRSNFYLFFKKYSVRIIINLLLVILPMILLNLGFIKYFSEWQYRQMVKNTQAIGEQVKRSVNIAIEGIENNVLNQTFSWIGSDVIESKLNMKGIFVARLLTVMNSLKSIGDFIDSIYYIDTSTGIVVKSEYGLEKVENLNKTLVSDLHAKLSIISYSRIWKNEKSRKISSIIVKENKDPFTSYKIIYNIDIEKLYDYYINILSNEDKKSISLSLFNSSNNLLAPSQYEKGDHYIRYDLRNGWYIKLSFNRKIMLKPVTNMIAIWYLMFFVCLMITVTIIMLTGKRLYKPIKNLMSAINIIASYKDYDEIHMLDVCIKELVNKNESLNSDIINLGNRVKMHFIQDSIAPNSITGETEKLLYDNDSIKMIITITFDCSGLNDYSVQKLINTVKHSLLEIYNDLSDNFIIVNRITYLEFVLFIEHTVKGYLDHVFDTVARLFKTYEWKLYNIYIEHEYFNSFLEFHEKYSACSGSNKDKLMKHMILQGNYLGSNNFNMLENIVNTDINELKQFIYKSRPVLSNYEHLSYSINLFMILVLTLRKRGIKANDAFYQLFIDYMSTNRQKDNNLDNWFDIMMFEAFNIKSNGQDTGLIESGKGSQNKHKQFIDNFIHVNYAKNIGVTELSDAMDISPQHVCTLTKKIFNDTFVNILNDYRIERAKQLLTETDILLEDISKTVGFSSRSYFSSLFKKKEGITPTEYRNNKQSENG